MIIIHDPNKTNHLISDYLFEVMMYVDNSSDFDKPNAAITDWKVLQDIVKRVGFRCRLVSSPGEIEENVDFQDVTKQ